MLTIQGERTSIEFGGDNFGPAEPTIDVLKDEHPQSNQVALGALQLVWRALRFQAPEVHDFASQHFEYAQARNHPNPYLGDNSNAYRG